MTLSCFKGACPWLPRVRPAHPAQAGDGAVSRDCRRHVRKQCQVRPRVRRHCCILQPLRRRVLGGVGRDAVPVHCSQQGQGKHRALPDPFCCHLHGNALWRPFAGLAVRLRCNGLAKCCPVQDDSFNSYHIELCFCVNLKTLMGYIDPFRGRVGAPHQCSLGGSAASNLCR